MQPLTTHLHAKIQSTWGVLQGTVGNFTSARQVAYVVEPINWAIKAVGEEIVTALNHNWPNLSRVTATTIGLRRSVIHYGSINSMIGSFRQRAPHHSNKIVVTIFHVLPQDPRADYFKPMGEAAALVHTASTLTKQALLAAGISEHKIVTLPIGVDLQLFQAPSRTQRQAARSSLGLPIDSFIIGSFQKDGDGWGKGNKPKYEKGPDILVEVLKEVAKIQKIFVVLVGPARGYVTTELRRYRILYKNFGYQPTLQAMLPFYHTLDAYVLTSRTEGGPRQLFEAWATGVPMVTTAVGMVPDVARDNHDALIAATEDVSTLVRHLKNLTTNPALGKRLTQAAHTSVKPYSWPQLITRYYDTLYRPLL